MNYVNISECFLPGSSSVFCFTDDTVLLLSGHNEASQQTVALFGVDDPDVPVVRVVSSSRVSSDPNRVLGADEPLWTGLKLEEPVLWPV